jgi:hypothetical protein
MVSASPISLTPREAIWRAIETTRLLGHLAVEGAAPDHRQGGGERGAALARAAHVVGALGNGGQHVQRSDMERPWLRVPKPSLAASET